MSEDLENNKTAYVTLEDIPGIGPATVNKLKESFGILPQMYHCENCDYEGPLILELEPEEEEP